MLNSIMVNDQMATVFDEEDFIRLVRTHMGEDAVQWFKDFVEMQADKTLVYLHNNSITYCDGECDRITLLAEDHRETLRMIWEKLSEFYRVQPTKRRPRNIDLVEDVLAELKHHV